MSDNSPPIITKSILKKDLTALGVAPSDCLMLHVSVKSIGWLVGGPDILMMALLELLGPDGTLMMYVGWEDGPYTMDGWSEEKKVAYLKECPGFDPITSRTVVEWSVVAEIVRKWPGAVRSTHPDGSYAAIGKMAASLMADHPLKYGYGANSPLAKLVASQGKILNIGAPLNTTNLLHYAEDQSDVPNKRIVTYQMPVKTADGVEWVEIEEFDTSDGIIDGYEGDYFTDLMAEYIEQYDIRAGKIGEARSYLFEAVHLSDYAISWMEANLIKL